MSASLAQLTAQIQIPLEKIPYYRARSRESDFAERLSADLASAVILDQSERQQLLSKASIPLSVVRLDTTDNPPLLATPIKTPITKIDCHDGAVICKISQNSSQHDFHPYDSRLHKPQNIEPFMYSTLEDDVSEGSQSMDIDNKSVSDWSAIQTPASERRDRLNNNILRELFPAGSVGLMAGTSNEMDTAVAEAVRQDASTENTAYGSRVSNTEVPDDIPFFDQSSNFLSSDSNLQEEQLPARESTKDSAQTPGESSRKTPLQNSGYSNDATDRATGHHESDQLTQESQLTVKPQFGRPENSFANGDSLEDTESQFIPTHAHQAGQNTLRPETNSENPATLTEALIKDTDVDLSEISSRGTPESSLGSVEYCSNVESDARKSRKRRRAVASQNEDDDTGQ